MGTPSFQPLYQQIKALLEQSLEAHEWRPGEAIPSETLLAARYNVAQGTVRKAIDALATTVAPSVMRRVVGSAVMTKPVSSAAVCQAYFTSPTAPGLPFSSCRGASSIYAAGGSSVQGPAATNEPLSVTAPSLARPVTAQ